MSGCIHRWMVAVLVGAGACWASGGVAATDLPKATQKILSDLKFDSSILSGLDKELTVPPAWIEAAKALPRVMTY